MSDCIAAFGVGLSLSPSDDQTAWFEPLVVLVGFPALLVAAARFEPGAFTGRIFSTIGLVSYGVYLLHQPMGNIVRTLMRGHGQIPTDWRGPIFGAAFIVLVMGLSWWLDGHYDAPVRRWLRGKFMPPKAAPPKAAALADA